MTNDVYLFPSAPEPKDVILRPIPPIIVTDKSGSELYSFYEAGVSFKSPRPPPTIHLAVPIDMIGGIGVVTRDTEIPHERSVRKMEYNPITLTPSGKTVHRNLKRIKPRYAFRVIRNGEVIYERWKKDDLLVWRGQMSLAYLISQGAVGSAVGTFMLVMSENSDMPDMGHDSGDPLANEFNPIIGTPISGTWSFEPDVKPTGQYQLQGWLYCEADLTADRDATLRKIGIIDNTATPNRRIVTEDRVVDVNILEDDVVTVRYYFPLG